MFRLLFALIVAGFCINGCAQTMKIKANPTAGQRSIYENGKELLVSQKKSLLAVAPLTGATKSNQRPKFIISYFNGASIPLNFSTENIAAVLNGLQIKIFTFEELAEEIERNRRSQALTAALVGASQMINASSGMQYHSGSYNTSYYGSGGAGYGYGTYSGTTYDSTAAAQAQAVIQAQTMSNINNANATASNALSDIERTILKKQTVMPQNWHGGYVALQRLPLRESENKLTIVIKVDDENHVFEYEIVNADR
ncbi:MAG: hypothetical protein NDI77_08180 [Geobacteraceae bacterium]|nr:hypothetical protein [Geobacteraceae bacterium]